MSKIRAFFYTIYCVFQISRYYTINLDALILPPVIANIAFIKWYLVNAIVSTYYVANNNNNYYYCYYYYHTFIKTDHSVSYKVALGCSQVYVILLVTNQRNLILVSEFLRHWWFFYILLYKEYRGSRIYTFVVWYIGCFSN